MIAPGHAHFRIDRSQAGRDQANVCCVVGEVKATDDCCGAGCGSGLASGVVVAGGWFVTVTVTSSVPGAIRPSKPSRPTPNDRLRPLRPADFRPRPVPMNIPE